MRGSSMRMACLRIALVVSILLGPFFAYSPQSTAAMADPARDDLGDLVQIKQGERTFAFPSRYFLAPPSARSRDRGDQWERFSIAFWYPDLLPPKRHAEYTASYRPKEPQRSQSTDNFIVEIAGVRARPASSTDPLPAERYRNLRNFGDRYSSVVPEFGLITYRDSYQQNPSDVYFSETGEFQLYMHCDRFPPVNKFIINPSCQASVFYAKSGIEFTLLFKGP
jgi:hypothetical protein